MAHVPDHTAISIIGHGSYGEVWLAKTALGKFRAVKIVYRDRFDEIAPFDREFAGICKFEPISRSHPSLVDVLHVGKPESGAFFYYIMELADDVRTASVIVPETYVPNSLSEQIRLRKRLPTQECVKLGLALSDGLAHLHESGLLHRDVKPSNVVFVDGHPKIADIGLVTSIEDAKTFVGTQGFIPPEGPGTEQADIFALGKLLYEASTGRDRQQFPELPTMLGDADAEREFIEFNEVITRACDPNPNRRYRRMRELEADLKLLAEGKSLRRLRALEKRATFTKRALLTAGGIALAAALPIYQFLSLKEERAKSRQVQVGAEIGYGARDVSEGNFLLALKRFKKAFELDAPDRMESRIHRMRLESTARFCPRLTTSICLSNDIQKVEFSPDGKVVLVTEYFKRLRLIDADAGTLIGDSFGPNYVHAATFSPDGARAVASVETDYAAIWDLKRREEIARLDHKAKVLAASFDPSGERIVTGGLEKIGRVFSTRTGETIAFLRGHEDAIIDARFSPDGAVIVTASRDKTARLWNAATGDCIAILSGHARWILHANFSPDGRLVVTSSHDGAARIWEVKTGQRIGPMLEHRDSVANARFSPDGRYVLTAGHDGTARLWRTSTWTPARRNSILPHPTKVRDAAFSPDGRRIVTACVDGSVRIWDLSEAGIPFDMDETTVSENGKIAAKREGNSVEIRSLANANPTQIRSIKLNSPPLEILLNATGTALLTRYERARSNVLEVLRVSDGQLLGRTTLDPTNTLQSIISADDGTCVLTFTGPRARIHDFAANMTQAFTFSNLVSCARFGPNDQPFAIGEGKSVHLFRRDQGNPKTLTLAHTVQMVAFSPDSTKLIVATRDSLYTPCSARIFDVRTGTPFGSALDHGDGVNSAVFSADGKMVVTAGEDLNAVIWDVKDQAAEGRILPHNHQVFWATFDESGRLVATFDRGGFVRLWDSKTAAPVTPPFAGPLVRPRSMLLTEQAVYIFDAKSRAFRWRMPQASSSLSAGVSALLENMERTTLPFASPQIEPPEISRWHAREMSEAIEEGVDEGAAFHGKFASP